MSVWDAPVRVLHWALVAGVAAAWITSANWTRWHEPLGYATLAVVLLRLVWGVAGNRYARFAQFVRSPSATLDYARQLLERRAPRHVGHNPLGAWMIMALLACVAATAATGWLYTTDRYWGDAAVDGLHLALAWLLLALVALHIGGVVWSSRRQRENLVVAIFSGSKRAARDDDVA